MKNLNMKKRKNKLVQPLLADLFAKIGKKIGIEVFLEPEWGVVGQLNYANGTKRYFRGTTLDINTMGASEIARDKDYSKIFMQSMGYKVIPWRKFYSNKWAEKIGSKDTVDAAYKYASTKLHLPVFLKPNSKSQGVGVTRVHTKTEFYKIFRSIARIDNVVLVEKAVTGKDYRVVVLDDEIISAYERIPLMVEGDGRRTILQLLKVKQKEFIAAGRDKTFTLEDPRLLAVLQRQKLSFDSVIAKGITVQLLYNANLSSGGTSVDVTDRIHPFFKELAIKLTKDMGLRLCGVDLMIEGDIFSPTEQYYIIEINSAPGLDHYAALGKKQQDIVERLYTKVLIAMGKSS
jgi:D-alanine-D-alanine ligase-like ATP-grasp enzyme